MVAASLSPHFLCCLSLPLRHSCPPSLLLSVNLSSIFVSCFFVPSLHKLLSFVFSFILCVSSCIVLFSSSVLFLFVAVVVSADERFARSLSHILSLFLVFSLIFLPFLFAPLFFCSFLPSLLFFLFVLLCFCL